MPELLPSLDIDRTAEHLRLEHRGRDRGLRELPPTTQPQLDPAEREALRHEREVMHAELEEPAKQLATLNQRIREIDVPRQLRELERAPICLARKLRRLGSRTEVGWTRAAEYDAAMGRAFEAFRDERGIRREPRYPSSPLAPVALLAAVVVAKAGLAAHLVARDASLVPGVVVLAAIDALVPFLLGRVAPWLGTGTALHRLVGALSLVALLGWIFGVNVTLRVVGADPAWAGPVGMGLSVLAALIGVCSEDSHPGYGRLHRRREQARDELYSWRTAAREGASALHDRQQAEIDRLAAEIPRNVEALEHRIEAKRQLLREVYERVQQRENRANALLRVYRDANLEHRTTPAPGYFERNVHLEVPELFHDSLEGDLAWLREARCDARQAERALPELRDATRGALDATLGRWEELERGELGAREACPST